MLSNPILKTGEEIGFQIKEGPCSAGCEYCYERPIVLKLLSKAKKEGRIKKIDYSMNNLQLAGFLQKNKKALNLEMSLTELKKHFKLLNKADIKRVFLIGSEPCSHSRFKDILDNAAKFGIGLTVYTSGISLQQLKHKAVKTIILHLGKIPNTIYMGKVSDLIKKEKTIELRINFASSRMLEKTIIFGFYHRLNKADRKKVLLKYSFNSKVEGNLCSPSYVTPKTLRNISSNIIKFIDEFKMRYPEIPMKAERPLFRCAFLPLVWKKYEKKGGFRSLCNMDFTVYIKKGLAFCPPARNLKNGKTVDTIDQFKKRIISLRKLLHKLKFKPSFEDCKKCKYRLNKLCQGGCLGYKLC